MYLWKYAYIPDTVIVFCVQMNECYLNLVTQMSKPWIRHSQCPRSLGTELHKDYSIRVHCRVCLIHCHITVTKFLALRYAIMWPSEHKQYPLVLILTKQRGLIDDTFGGPKCHRCKGTMTDCSIPIRVQSRTAADTARVVQVLGRSVDMDSIVRLGAGCKANMDDPRSFRATLPGLAEVYPRMRALCAPEQNSK